MIEISPVQLEIFFIFRVTYKILCHLYLAIYMNMDFFMTQLNEVLLFLKMD